MRGAQEWLDDFFESYLKFRPVNATFIGVHDYDDNLPDYSTEGIKVLADSMSELIESAAEPSSTTEELDLAAGTSFLKIQLAEFELLQTHHNNPSLYTSEATFGMISLCLRDTPLREERIKSMVHRMRAIPLLLAAGKENVRASPKYWKDEALRQCVGAVKFLDEGVKSLIKEWGVTSTALEASAAAAKQSFLDYADYLSTLRTDSSYGCGASFFNLLLKEGHFVDGGPETLLEHANERFSEIKDRLVASTKKIRDDGDWNPILKHLSESFPSPESLIGALNTCWTECRRVAVEKHLVDWPDYPIVFRYVPERFRSACHYLYFLWYRSPPPFDDAAANEYLVMPISKPDTQDPGNKPTSAMNYTAIKHNHVIHHSGLGHHVQNWYAYHSGFRIGKIAGVDCSSRIAMFCGGTMTEGWACYSTLLMDECGINSQEEHIAELHSELRMAARTIVDVMLHTQGYSFEDAVNFYVENVDMSLDSARKEVTKNSMFPCTASMYLLGVDQIVALRELEQRRLGGDFSLGAFHNKLLSFGSLPVSLIAKEMTRSRE